MHLSMFELSVSKIGITYVFYLWVPILNKVDQNLQMEITLAQSFSFSFLLKGMYIKVFVHLYEVSTCQIICYIS